MYGGRRAYRGGGVGGGRRGANGERVSHVAWLDRWQCMRRQGDGGGGAFQCKDGHKMTVEGALFNARVFETPTMLASRASMQTWPGAGAVYKLLRRSNVRQA